LRALILATYAERDAILAERDAAVTERNILQTQNDWLRHLLLKLTRMQFGARSERLPEEQLQLGLEALEQAIAKEDAVAEKQNPELRKGNAARRRANRGALPAHLPRIEVTLLPEDTACPCCQAPMTVIGEDTSERLDVISVQFRVIVTKRPKLACRACPGTVVQEPAPARLIEGGIPTEAMVAHVAVSRYADHQPLYRQAQIMARQGVILDRSTLSFWMGYAAAEIAPVVTRLREMMLASTRIFVDEERHLTRRRDRCVRVPLDVDTAGEGVDRYWFIAGIFNQRLFTRRVTWETFVALTHAPENAGDSRKSANSIAGFRINGQPDIKSRSGFGQIWRRGQRTLLSFLGTCFVIQGIMV